MDWFRREAGRRFMAEAQRECIPEMTRVFGSSGLYLRPIAEVPPELSGNMIARMTSLHRHAEGFAGQLRCRDAELPIATNSQSLVYALFVLETSPDPAGLLQEFSRILKPEGVALIVNLNPWSPARLRWLWKGAADHGARHVESLASRAGLEVVRRQMLGPLWIGGQTGTKYQDRRKSLVDPLRAASLLVARRREAPLTPLRAPAPVVNLRPGMSTGLVCP